MTDLNASTESFTSTTASEKTEFKLYRRRWLVLMAQFGLMFMRNLSAICVSSGTSSIANAFNQQYWVINLSVSISAAVYVPTFIGSTYLFNMLECRTVMAIGAGLMLVGAWTRSLAMLNDNYWWVVIGQLIIACAGPTLQSPISTIANNWFGDHERAKATSLMSLSSPLGSLLGFIIQAIYIAITEEKTKNVTTAEAQQIVRQETLAMLNFESAMTTFVVLFFFLAFRKDKPPSPPSAAALAKHQDITKGMWNDTKTLASNFNFMLILAIFSLVFAIYSALGFVIDPLLVPFGFQPLQIATMAILFVLVGSVSAVAVGIFLDRTKKYLWAIRAIPIAGSLMFLATAVVIPTGNLAGSLTVVCLSGVATVPVIAVCFSLGTEVSYPVQPALGLGMMMSAAQLCLFGMNYIFLALLSTKNGKNAHPIQCLLVMALLPFVSSIFSLFVKEDLRRLNAGKNKERVSVN